ncbi:hypothetical protein OESDEN_21949, partial [Oesophagostomum dentatum]
DDDEDIVEDNINDKENFPPKNPEESVASAAAEKGSNDAAEVQQTVPTEELHFGDIEDDDLQNSVDLNSLYGGMTLIFKRGRKWIYRYVSELLL